MDSVCTLALLWLSAGGVRALGWFDLAPMNLGGMNYTVLHVLIVYYDLDLHKIRMSCSSRVLGCYFRD